MPMLKETKLFHNTSSFKVVVYLVLPQEVKRILKTVRMLKFLLHQGGKFISI